MNQVEPIDFLPVEKIRVIQENKFAQLMEYLAIHSEYYKRIFMKKGINPHEIKLADLSKLPFTTKDDLAANNDDFLCIDKSKIADYVTTSGTLSDPVTFYLSSNDLERLAMNEAESLQCAGGTATDIYQLTTTLDKQLWQAWHIIWVPENWEQVLSGWVREPLMPSGRP